jgi:hypothetical protein
VWELVLSEIGSRNYFVKCLNAELAAQNVDENEDDNHQDGNPNRDSLKRAHASYAPVERKLPVLGKDKVAIPASLRLKGADAATLRAGLGIEPLRHHQEIARGVKTFQWYEQGNALEGRSHALGLTAQEDGRTRRPQRRFGRQNPDSQLA